MKKVIMVLFSIFLLIGVMGTSVVSASEVEKVSLEVINGEESNGIMPFEVVESNPFTKIVTIYDGKDTYEYDAFNETLKINEKQVLTFKTTIDYLDPEAGISKEEALELEKIRIYDELTDLNKIPLFIDTKNFTFPSNAPYTVYATYTKKLQDSYGELGQLCGSISVATALYSLTKLPYSAVVGQVSSITGIASATIATTKGNIGGEYKYTQHRTTQKYPYYGTQQYGYRYAHTSLKTVIKIGSKTYSGTKNQSGVGTWWSANKPY